MDLSNRQELTWLSGVLRDVHQAGPQFKPLVVGATARDLLLHYVHAVPIARATSDVDLAFAVPDWAVFDALRFALIASGAFVADRAHHRVLHRGGTPIDLIPFGGVEARDGAITWPADNSVMKVLGYREALASAVELMLPGSQRVFTVYLPMLAILKLIAWAERHVSAPRKDARDFFLIVNNYLNKDNTVRLYDEAAHLLEVDDFDYQVAGGWLAGHDAACLIAAHSAEPEVILNACIEIVVLKQILADGCSL